MKEKWKSQSLLLLHNFHLGLDLQKSSIFEYSYFILSDERAKWGGELEALERGVGPGEEGKSNVMGMMRATSDRLQPRFLKAYLDME